MSKANAEKILKKKGFEYQYNFNSNYYIHTLTDYRKFWKKVKTADGISNYYYYVDIIYTDGYVNMISVGY